MLWLSVLVAIQVSTIGATFPTIRDENECMFNFSSTVSHTGSSSDSRVRSQPNGACDSTTTSDHVIVSEATEISMREEYDQLSTALHHHFQLHHEPSSSLLNDPYNDFHQSMHHYINLSPKEDSSLVRSQSHKLLSDRFDNENITDISSGMKTSVSRKRQKLLLNVKNLTRIVRLNRDDHTVTVQARCTYDQLVRTLLDQFQMVPLVVPEFKSITVGGAIVGGALESSSFRYGQVSDTVTSMMILFPNGTRSTITELTHSELYHAIPGSYGSLVIILEATVRVRPIVSNFVELQLSTYSSIEGGILALQQYNTAAKENDYFDIDQSSLNLPDFVDAIQFPNGDFVIISGSILAQPQQHHSSSRSASTTSHLPPLIRTEHRSSKWFYECVYDLVQTQKRIDKKLYHASRDVNSSTSSHVNEFSKSTIHMPIYDYLFRYERGAFWMGRPIEFTWMTVLKNPLLLGPFLMSWKYTRFLFGHYFTATILYRLLHAIDSTTVAEKFLIQDAYLPSQNTTQFVHYIRRNIPITVPIWLCPVRRPLRTQPLSPSGKFDDRNREASDDTLINVGVWGRVDDNNGIRYMEQMEQEMIQLNGRKMLYSVTSASLMPYETLYDYHIDGTKYFELRTKYGANHVFPPIHEKLRLLSRDEVAQQQKRRPKRNWKYWISRIMT